MNLRLSFQSILLTGFMFIACTPQHRDTSFQFDLSPKKFQSEINSKSTNLYFLGNGNIHAAVTNYGGRIVGLSTPDKDQIQSDIVLGFNSLDEYINANEVFHGAIIGRVGNRIANGKFALNDTTYSLPLNNGQNHLHGGPMGFHNVVWDVKELTDSSILLAYYAVDGEMGYPGNLNVEVEYTCTYNLELMISYKASTDKATPINLTNHAFFNLAGEGNGTINRHILTVNAEYYTPVDSTLIPLGENALVEDTPFDFRQAKSIGDDLFEEKSNKQLIFGMGYDHNFVLNIVDKKSMMLAARVVEPESGRVMEILTEEPGLQFYGGNFMDGSDIGKSGSSYKFRESFALETQHFPNSPNNKNFPSIILYPEDVYSTTTIYRFSVEK